MQVGCPGDLQAMAQALPGCSGEEGALGTSLHPSILCGEAQGTGPSRRAPAPFSEWRCWLSCHPRGRVTAKCPGFHLGAMLFTG